MIKNIDKHVNKDNTQQGIILRSLVIKTTVYDTTTVFCVDFCTTNPIPIDIFRIVKPPSSLTCIEGLLQIIMN